jgi:AraC family transcriptional activator of pobA
LDILTPAQEIGQGRLPDIGFSLLFWLFTRLPQMSQEHLPIYQIQDFHAPSHQQGYFYLSSFAQHLQEHLFIQKPHKHNFYILLFITQGSGTHTIDFKEYPVAPNHIFFMAPGQVHSWELSEDTAGFILFFTQEYYQQEFPQKKLYNYPFFNALLHQPYLRVSATEEAALLWILQHMQVELAGQQLMQANMLRLYLDMLLILLAREYQSLGIGVQAPGGTLSELQTLENLIDLHYKDHLPVSFYADQLHVTARQLNETCKRSLNKTATALIQERILLEAKRLLVHADLTSSQIAAYLGYMDTPYFFRFFKKHIGLTPEQFRLYHK